MLYLYSVDIYFTFLLINNNPCIEIGNYHHVLCPRVSSVHTARCGVLSMAYVSVKAGKVNYHCAVFREYDICLQKTAGIYWVILQIETPRMCGS